MGKWLKTKDYIEFKKLKIKEEISEIKRKYKKIPSLFVLMVGNNPESRKYVENKKKLSEELGLYSETIFLPENTEEKELISKIEELSKNPDVSGILVQLPLPSHIHQEKIINSIPPSKDVDGFTPENLGLLLRGVDALFPCTPLGIVNFLKYKGFSLEGKRAVVIGRSNIVGKPLALLLLRENATVSILHSRTKNIEEITKTADFLFSAVGKPFFVKKSMVKERAIVVDVGINYIDDEEFVKRELKNYPKKIEKFKNNGYLFVGDVHPDVKEKSLFLTPVPGGVGKLTVLTLIENTIKAFYINNHTKEA